MPTVFVFYCVRYGTYPVRRNWKGVSIISYNMGGAV